MATPSIRTVCECHGRRPGGGCNAAVRVHWAARPSTGRPDRDLQRGPMRVGESDCDRSVDGSTLTCQTRAAVITRCGWEPIADGSRAEAQDTVIALDQVTGLRPLPAGAGQRAGAMQRHWAGGAEAQDAVTRRHHAPGDVAAGATAAAVRLGAMPAFGCSRGVSRGRLLRGALLVAVNVAEGSVATYRGPLSAALTPPSPTKAPPAPRADAR